jgi:phosphatidylserine/phosphatidylglycerophosphate/cardiolipin synthase-like enzyme
MTRSSYAARRAVAPVEDAAIFRPGENCWRLARAQRAAVVVDGRSYFSTFADAAALARHSILIVGWDFNSYVRLHPDDPVGGQSDEIGAFLTRLVKRRRALHVYVLDWDFAVIYAMQRELLPRFRLARRTHRRFHFRLDSRHPLGAAQHQKIVVIDDAVAFVGGFDFAACRWDTSHHQADDPQRLDPWGKQYPPYHDLELAVDGDAAAALGELVRERWWRASGERLAAAPPGRDPWPRRLRADFRDVEVAIARTEPAYDGIPEAREVERLYVDCIAAARRSIYIENQYLTSNAIGDALAARLAEEDGPEVVVLQPRQCEGWLEQTTMGVLRARLLRRLQAIDRRDRLRVYHPVVPGLGDRRLTVHSKLLIIDDRLLRIGSANLNNRSMGLDTECDLAIDAGDDAQLRARVAAVRARLLGEHLGKPTALVAEAVAAMGLIRTIETLGGGERGLRPLDPTVEPWLETLVPDAAIVDPERPVGAQALLAMLAPGPQERDAPPVWLWPAIVAAGAAFAIWLGVGF